jgi:diguanylate cyclase (GGDEF)-like protein
MDVDRFKQINDSLGYAIGDQLLQSVAQRLLGCVRATDTVSRQGGDEFVILLSEVALAQDAAVRADKIILALAAPHRIAGHELHITVSIGIVSYPDDATDVQTLMKNADVAMYHAKDSGRNKFQFFEPGMNLRAAQRQSIEDGLRHPVERGELFLHYQPDLDLNSRAVVGVEALVRWQHPQRGLVPPMEFIPFAEQTGFIRSITAWMIERGVAWLGQEAVRRAGLRLSLNLSVRDLLDHDLAARVARHLQRHGVRPDRLGLEITESAIMDDPQRAQATLEQLHQLGVWLSIDDYGTGYSSLAYLKRLRVDELKIDKSFVMAMAGNDDDAKIVRSTIELGHNLGLSVVAEGVETEGAWRLLAQWGCDDAQGYLMGKPMPAEDFDAWNATFSRQASAAMVPLLPA